MAKLDDLNRLVAGRLEEWREISCCIFQVALKRERTKVRDRSSSKLPWLGRPRGGGEGVGVVRRK